MKPKEQRIAILEFLGWTDLKKINFGALRGTSPTGEKNSIAPNPLTNLNIIHKVEEKIPSNLRARYWSIICVLNSGKISLHGYFYSTHVSAAQKCEAILKTLDKWLDN
jgi:hypothetical protein